MKKLPKPEYAARAKIRKMFAIRKHAQLYPPSKDPELDAVCDRRKAISWVAFDAEFIDEDNSSYLALVTTALARGLSITRRTRIGFRGHPQVDVYTSYPDQAWRADAHDLLLNLKSSTMSLELDELQSRILGYPDEHIEEYLDRLHSRSIGYFRAPTTHVVMHERFKNEIIRTGWRSIPTDAFSAGITLVNPGGWYVIRRDANKDVPRGFVLARVAMSRRFFYGIWPPFDPSVETRPRGSRVQLYEVPVARAEDVQHALRSNIEFRTKDGWTPQLPND